MIIIYHADHKVREVADTKSGNTLVAERGRLAAVLHKLAEEFPDEIIVWCHVKYKAHLNSDEISKFFTHDQLLMSYNPSESNFLGDEIGYIEDSIFIKVNKSVTFPTWRMSSEVGAIHASVLVAVKDKISFDDNFDYYLNSMAKILMPSGLICYSEPKLLTSPNQIVSTGTDFKLLFRFVKQHYKARWCFLLLLNLFVYERKLPLLHCLASLFFRKRTASNIQLKAITNYQNETAKKESLDVIIPTIGRKAYLYDFLTDLKNQSHLPDNVIIVEQNPTPNGESELNYLTSEIWPFKIRHQFTRQPGACNARNLALPEITSEWVFLADDDIRIQPDFVVKVFENIHQTGFSAVSVACLKHGQQSQMRPVFQYETFGSGCSFVNGSVIKNCHFHTGYEFGYGEDSDFGMQIRNSGHDIAYISNPSIIHLSAPMGGFRTKIDLQWHADEVQPKPSPTVMLNYILHKTKQQRSGYKTTLFFKFYRHQKTRNIFKYYKEFQKRWDKSVFYANQLNRKK